MICRLCLNNLNGKTTVFLFDTRENIAETDLLEIIAKYIPLELSHNDPISTSICQECCDHLKSFHSFWMLVNQKQSTLHNEFLEVKCEVNLLNEDNEESILDLKNIPMEFAEAASNEEFGCANKIYVDQANTVSIAALDDNDSVDDNTSLLTLLNRSKSKRATKSNVSKRKSKRRKSSEVKLVDGINEKNSSIKSIASKSVIKRNEETITNFMKLSCDLCNMPLDNFNELRTHFLTMHQRSAYVKCCRRSYSRPANLVEHIRWHQNPDVYKCNICDKRLRSEHSLQMHNETHSTSDEINLNCRVCNKTFVSQNRFKNHVLKHKNDKDHNCAMCNKSFLTAQRLRMHINSVHKNVYPHICDTCGKKFKCKTSFEKHLLEHQGIVDPPAQCEVCGEWLKNKGSLRLHRFKHDTVNVECQICHHKCLSRMALYRHISRNHKREQNLQCKYCDKSFKLPQSLQEHVATHTGAQLYSCPHCSKEYRSRANMYVHIKRFHVEEWIKAKMARSHDPNLKPALE